MAISVGTMMTLTVMWVFYGNFYGNNDLTLTVMWVFYAISVGTVMTLTVMWVFYGNFCGNNDHTDSSGDHMAIDDLRKSRGLHSVSAHRHGLYV